MSTAEYILTLYVVVMASFALFSGLAMYADSTTGTGRLIGYTAAFIVAWVPFIAGLYFL